MASCRSSRIVSIGRSCVHFRPGLFSQQLIRGQFLAGLEDLKIWVRIGAELKFEHERVVMISGEVARQTLELHARRSTLQPALPGLRGAQKSGCSQPRDQIQKASSQASFSRKITDRPGSRPTGPCSPNPKRLMAGVDRDRFTRSIRNDVRS
jgi:hypothetical protein